MAVARGSSEDAVAPNARYRSTRHGGSTDFASSSRDVAIEVDNNSNNTTGTTTTTELCSSEPRIRKELQMTIESLVCSFIILASYTQSIALEYHYYCHSATTEQ